MIQATIKLNMSGFNGFVKTLHQGLAGGDGGEVGSMFKKWNGRYLAFSRRRYKTLSSGGSVQASQGDQSQWPALKASTLARKSGKPVTRVNQAFKHGEISAAQYATKLKQARAKAKRQRKKTAQGKSKTGILMDTATLYNALTTGMPGNLMQRIKNGIRVGIAGPGKHPGGKATIADIAAAHNSGGGNLPRRQIIAHPDTQTTQGMQTDLRVCAKRIMDANKIR